MENLKLKVLLLLLRVLYPVYSTVTVINNLSNSWNCKRYRYQSELQGFKNSAPGFLCVFVCFPHPGTGFLPFFSHPPPKTLKHLNTNSKRFPNWFRIKNTGTNKVN